MPPRDVPLGGVEASRHRARVHRDAPERQIDRATGRPKLEEMRPQDVTVTLRDELAPTFSVIPSPHRTRVVTPEGLQLADLPPGTPARFDLVSGAWKRATAPS